MEALFIRILNMSLTAGYCIVAVILLRFMLKRQAKILSYLLWSVVLFRLLCPFSLTSSYSLLRMDTGVISREILAGERENMGQGKKVMFDENAGITEEERKETVSLTDAGERAPAEGWRRMVFFGSRIWLAGAAVLLAAGLWSALRCRHFLSQAVLLEDNVYEAEGIATSFVFGIVRPKIYLSSRVQPQERPYVLEHERVHIARKDYLMKFLAWGAVCLHWFNPLVWLAFALMERDMEMSCDEAVLRRLGENAQQAYSLALLQLSCEEDGCFRSPLAFGEGNVKGRIKNILGWHRRRIVTVALPAVLLGVVMAGLALNPAKREEKETAVMGDFVNAYAIAWCERDGDALVSMYADEETAYESLPLLERTGGGYSFGFSSPWPDEFCFVLNEDAAGEEGRAEIWYYAWTSDPHVAVWKENIQFLRTEEGQYRVKGSEFRYLDNISSETEFEEAYLIDGKYQFTDYAERGFLEAILTQTVYDAQEGNTDRNAVYRDPATAAEWILNLTGGQGETVVLDSDHRATVRYTFADGGSVEIPMYNAAREETEKETENGAAGKDVWLLDRKAWNAYLFFKF